MATLTSFLPAPTQPTYSLQEEHSLFKSAPAAPQQQAPKPKKQVPPYGQRQGFIPRSVEDFGDGGAFPEIHVAQYPLDMGKKKSSNDKAVIPVTLDSSGRVKSDALLGSRGDKKVFSQYTDLVERQADEEELARPSAEELDDVTARTRAALEKIVSTKIQAAQPSAPVTQGGAPTYIKYTPAQQGASFNSGAGNRIIRMVEMPKDPLEPAKFKNKRVARGPPSPPVPVMHSPPRKVTMKDQQLWKIPPCISNWKNSKGYTIPLDKRLAADGRGLQEVQINDKFAQLSNTLYVAERTAREEVATRTLIQKNVLQRDKAKREDMLRKLAEDARSHRTTGVADDAEEPEQTQERMERDVIREERGRERTRELRMEAAGKKGKILRDEDRDISEKVALGQGGGAGPRSEEAMFDQRLFNQTQGLEGGFGDEDSYTVYSKPLFGGSSANVMYRPKKGADETAEEDMDKILKTNKFRPDKEFDGVDKSKTSEPRNRPVEFEKQPEEDPFGLDEFLSSAKKSSSSTAKRPLDKIGSKGALHAGSAGSKDYQSQDKDSKRKRIDFDGARSNR